MARDLRVTPTTVNARPHAETREAPAARLLREREALRPLPASRPLLAAGERRKVDKLSTVRFGSARYSVPHLYAGGFVEVTASDGEVMIRRGEEEIARHPLTAPG